MTRARTIGLVLVLASIGACGGGPDGPPAIEIDRSACAHCGMLISEPRFAAAHQAAGAEARVFDDIGCLLDALGVGGAAPEGRFWFHDATSAEWIGADRAVFIQSPQLRTPMASGLAAYGSEEAARRAATDGGGRVVGGLAELLARNRKEGEE